MLAFLYLWHLELIAAVANLICMLGLIAAAVPSASSLLLVGEVSTVVGDAESLPDAVKDAEGGFAADLAVGGQPGGG
jgi:hypothetical protein